MAKNKTVRVTEEELDFLKALRTGQSDPEVVKETESVSTAAPAAAPDVTAVAQAQQALADAFVNAIERTRPPEKKTVANYKSVTPWSPPDGVPQAKLKRKMFQHGIPLETKMTNEEINLLNLVRPGHYCEGFVRVTVRKDRGLDIDYPVRTASQRLRMVNQYGIRSFKELLARVIDEHDNPTKYRRPDDMEIYG